MMFESPHFGNNWPCTRRQWLARSGQGLGLLAAADLLLSTGAHSSGLLGSAATAAPPEFGPAAVAAAGHAAAPHFAPRAKQVIHLFMNGGPSQVDTFDPKPALDKYHGRPLPTGNLRTERKTGAALKSPFKFQQYGQSGLAISELFAQTARHADELCVIRSMVADVPNHEPSLMLMNCGDARMPRPSVGSWITYGLGSENQNLPGFIAMCPGGYPVVGTQNWRSAFLPGAYQGTYLDTQHEAIEKLIENIRHPSLSPLEQRRQLDLVRALNERHAALRSGDAPLEARLRTFELAYRMQHEAAEAFDLSREPESIRALYGSGVHGRQLLITRRLIERGVRFVQVWSGGGQPWDNHANLEAEHRKLAGQWDQPIAALLTDLKQRGLLDTTVVMWGGEFGRTPAAESGTGRDHNHYGFSMWLAGGGVKGGYAHGATDEFGYQAIENKVHVHDLHATLLHLLGIDHERLTYRLAGRDFRLTDVHGKVVPALLR